ncbi:MAG: DUF4097 family beta strand repeat-containing protein [Solirubrobacteraceae bacterium]
MTVFNTPEPIFATIEVASGRISVNAGERIDTVVEVRPTDESHDADVEAAAQTRVDYSAGRLVIKGPKKQSWFGRAPSIEVDVDLPLESRVDARGAVEFRGHGRLGEAAISTSGDIRLDQAGRLRLTTGAGDIAVDRAAGRAELTTASGEIRIGWIEGPAIVKAARGAVNLGTVTGEVRARTASGDVIIEHAEEGVNAKTAHGDITIGEAREGKVVVESAHGNLEIGVPEGTSAWLDVVTASGLVRHELDAASAPQPDDRTLQVRGRTASGDIVIRRPRPTSRA